MQRVFHLLSVAVTAGLAMLIAPSDAAAQTGGPDTFGYVYAPAAYDFVSLAPAAGGSGTAEVVNSGSATITLPFPFRYYGNEYTEVVVDDEPGVSMGTGTTFLSGANSALPTSSSSHPDLAVFWDDINAAGGTIWSWYDAPNARLILSWEGHGVSGGSEPGAWQVHLSADHSIEYHYADTNFGAGTAQTSGGSATIGIQDRRGGTSLAGGFLQWSFNQPIIQDGVTAIGFSLCADNDADGWAAISCGGQDCDDTVGTTFPGASELCNGADDDCNPATSEVGDNDGDGQSACAGDCDDTEPTIFANAVELCDGIDNDCDGAVPGDETGDADGDGTVTCGDCDDGNALIFPSASELCDGLDTDCDGQLDSQEVDADGDGASFCLDCDDTEAGRAPGLGDACDGVDGDCGGFFGPELADSTFGGADRGRGLLLRAAGGTLTGIDVQLALPVGSTITWVVYEGTASSGSFTQLDVASSATTATGTAWHSAPALGIPLQPNLFYSVIAYWSVQGSYFGKTYSASATPGDYGTIMGGAAINGAPQATQTMSASGLVYAMRLHTNDELDGDGDGVLACLDCDDTNATIFPGAAEQCNGVDDDCDGALVPGEIDGDGDGLAACSGDCDDTNPAVAPGLTEVCDGVDTNCDGAFLSGELTDADNDGSLACADCDDSAPSVFPGATEVCNAVDEDCSGVPDDLGVSIGGGGIGGVITVGTPLVAVSSPSDPGTVADLNVSLSLSHTWVEDLDVFLSSPTGVQVELFTDVGGSGDDLVGTVLDDEAPTAITAGSAPFTGSFQPEGSLAAFDGQPIAGSWTLTITDDAGGDDGVLNDWSLQFTTTSSDADGDGFYSCDDCDDASAAVNPGAAEVCNGVDDNCDGSLPADEQDADGDGVTACAGDCDDSDASVAPGAAELCGDAIDQDCAGGDVPCTGTPGDLVINEVLADSSAVPDLFGEWIELYNPTSGPVTATGWEVLGSAGSSFVVTESLVVPAGGFAVLAASEDTTVNGGVTADFAWPTSFDLTDSGVGDITISAGGVVIDVVDLVTAGAPGITLGQAHQLDPDAPTATDNDLGGNWTLATVAYGAGDLGTPGAANTNLCAGADSTGDTDGDGDCDDVDLDDDGDGDPDATDCADADAAIFTGAPEGCDGIDTDCDGAPATGELDADGDGDGSAICADCDDADGTSFPGAPEVCDAVDHDCDGDPFNGAGQTSWYADLDGDGFGDPDSPHPDNPLCVQPDDHVEDASDCDDGDPAVNPDALEICDGVDGDCDPETEPEGGEADADGDGHRTCVDDADGRIDCDDENPDIHPEALERCDTEADEDCDGSEALIDSDPECWEPGCGASLAPGRALGALALLLIGGLVWRRRRGGQAVPVLLLLVALSPSLAHAGMAEEAKRQMEFAAQELANKRFDRALKSAESALRLCPDCLDAMVLKAGAYLGLGERKLAREVMLAYVEEVGESALSLDAQELYEKLVRRRERPGAARVGETQSASEEDPDVFRERIAEALANGRCRAARSAASELVILTPTDPQAWVLAGDAARCSDAVREAVLAYRKHVELGGSLARVTEVLPSLARQLGTVMVSVVKPDGVSSMTLLLDTGEEFIEGEETRTGWAFVDIAPEGPLVLSVVGTGLRAEDIEVPPLRAGERRTLAVTPVVVGFGTISVLPYKLDRIQASIAGPEGVIAARPGASMQLTVGQYSVRVESNNGMVQVPLAVTRGGLQTFDANEHEPSAITVLGLPAAANVRVFVEGLGGAVAEQQFRVPVAGAVLDETTGVLVAPPQKVRNLRPGRGGLFVEHPTLGEGSAEFVLTAGGEQTTEFDWKALPGMPTVQASFAQWVQTASANKGGAGKTIAIGAASGGIMAAGVAMFVVGGVTGSRMTSIRQDALTASDGSNDSALIAADAAFKGQSGLRTGMFVAGSICAGLGVLGGTITIATGGGGSGKTTMSGWDPANLPEPE